VRRPVFLGLAGIAALGAAATAGVLLFTWQPVGAPGQEPAPLPATRAAPSAAPPGGAAPSPPVQASRGQRSLQLPPGAAARDLTAALAPCHRGNPAGQGLPAVLTLELEAQAGGGLVVVDARVASRGGASEGLLACARQLLLGRRVTLGSFPPGEHFVTWYDVVSPSPAVSPPPDPPSTSPPANRLQRAQRRAGSR